MSSPRLRRWLCFCLLGLGGVLVSLAAKPPVTERTERLEREVQSAGGGAPFSWLLELSQLLEAEDTVRAWDYAKRARAVAGSTSDQLRADLWIDYLLWRQGRHAEAMKQAREALGRARPLRSEDLVARALLVIASAQDRMADFPSAMETYRELLPLAERHPDLGFRAQVYDMYGTTHFKTGNLEQTELNLQLAKKFAEQSANPLLLPPVIAHLGNLARTRGDVERGRALLQESIDLRVRNGGDTRGIADQEINLGAIAEDREDWPTALAHFSRAVELHSKMGFDLNHANARQCLAGILTRLGRTDEAMANLQIALKLVEPTGSQTILGRVYRELARLHETRGDFRAALEFARKQAAAEDAALGEKSRLRLDELNARFAAERRQGEIERLNQQRQLEQAELARVRWQRYSLLAGASGLAVLAVVLAGRFRSEHRLRLATERARAAAEETNDLKTRLLGMASHDLKAPLNAITHGSEALLHAPGDAAEVAATARLIRDTARRTHALVRDLIDVAALERGGLQLQLMPVDLAVLTAEVVGAFQPSAAHKRQAIEFTAAVATAPIVPADPERLRQAVSNLVDNALKFSPAGGRIAVAVSGEEHQCCIEVSDEGPGLTPADLAALFQPFRSLSTQPTGGEPSTGLGLHLTREIVGLLGGRVVADSVPGAGATFRIFLPRAAG